MEATEKQIYEQAVMGRRNAAKALNESGWKDIVEQSILNYWDFDSHKARDYYHDLDHDMNGQNFYIQFTGTFDFSVECWSETGLEHSNRYHEDVTIFGITGKVEVTGDDEQTFTFQVVNGEVID